VVLAKIRKISMQMAQKLNESGLSTFDGKIIVFEDSDVLALILKQSDSLQAVLEKLRSEFTHSGMIHLLVIEEMKDRLSQLLSFSEDKKHTAEDYRMKQSAVHIAGNLANFTDPGPEIRIAMQKKRRTRNFSSVLIIEDDVMVRGLLNTLLQDEHQVIQAKNAESGVIAYIDQVPNVVFLDINMPGMNGHETLKRLRMLDSQAYVIMLSGASSSENIISTKKAGAVGFISKPFSKEKLQQYIKKCPSLIT